MGLRTAIQSALLHHDIAMVLEKLFMTLPLGCSLELKFPKNLVTEIKSRKNGMSLSRSSIVSHIFT